MLMELKVANFAIIENIHIQFRSGLNILTGETGAGKSVLLKSLSLLMGFKSSTESIRSGFHQASIEGCFDLAQRPDVVQRLMDLGIECEERQLVVKRVLIEGKSRIYINGSLSTLNTLRDIVAPLIEVTGQTTPLIEMTGQFDNRHLLSKSYQLDVLDQYAGVWSLRMEYHKKFLLWKDAAKQLQTMKNNTQINAQRLDFLTYQRNEIQALQLHPQNDAGLEDEIRKLKSSAKLSQFVDAAEETLVDDGDSAIQRLNQILKQAFEVGQVDPAIAQKSDLLKQAKTLIEEGLFQLRQHVDKIEADPQRLEELEQRLSQLRKLQKKYGATIAEILQSLEQIEQEIHSLQNVDLQVNSLSKKYQELEKELRVQALALHQRRVSLAQRLIDSVNGELQDLNMKGVTFQVAVNAEEELHATGLSDVEFMCQTSSKDPHRPLAKFASGGELSRILLALKKVAGRGHQPRTYLFDEVDTGVSGPTAEKVGRKLHAIAEAQQVICVTHLPQVAACGDHHFFIQKSAGSSAGAEVGSSSGGGASMEVLELTAQERVNEIARLISGEKISRTSLAHAQELLREAR